MKKVGLYFGSFNPIHVGHVIVGEYLLEHSDLDELWFVVSPHNPFKKRHTLLDDYTRLHLVELALSNHPKLRPSAIEFGLPQPSYTIDTLTHLNEKHPDISFALIMGEDNLDSLHKWKSGNYLMENFPILVYPRIPSVEEKALTDAEKPEIELPENAQIHRVAAPRIELSSSEIRKGIKEGKCVRAMLPDRVWQYIDENILYK